MGWRCRWKATPPPSTPMTLIKLRIKGAMTCSVPATRRVAYSLPTPLVLLTLSPPPSFIPGSFLERPPSRFKPSSRSSSSILSNKVTRPRPPLLPFHLSIIDDEATSTVLVSSIDRSPRCMLKWPSADPLELFVRCIHTSYVNPIVDWFPDRDND